MTVITDTRIIFDNQTEYLDALKFARENPEWRKEDSTVTTAFIKRDYYSLEITRSESDDTSNQQ